jgi:SAM-dependent methyltransferase
MSSEHVYPLDFETLNLFAQKGRSIPQIANGNGLVVRRVMQIIRDIVKAPFEQLRILDFACGEGVYAIEAALRGAEVVAFDVRKERMDEGAKAVKRLGLNNLQFEQTDIRNVNLGSHGSADVILFLGILYHLSDRDVFPVLRNIYDMCRQFVIIDTHIALNSQIHVEFNGQSYQGKLYREHADNDSIEIRRGRQMASLDNPLSFWFTKESLFRLLNDVGFSSVWECKVPLDPFKPEDRITIIAVKGERVKISSYPWINDRTEDELYHCINDSNQQHKILTRTGLKQLGKSLINSALRPFGFKIERI